MKQIEGLHFLIVDDNRINQLVTRKILDSLAITSDVVDSGLKAIEISKTKTFDCILMDLHMPEMDGYTAAQHIREFNATTPIIALTAANTEEVEGRIKQSFMNACVSRPFFTPEFVKVINEVVV